MRTALITWLLAGIAFTLLNYGHLASNADFVYMCAAAELLKRGVLLASPYFPPGYPLLLWAVIQTGITPLAAGVLLSAFGTGLSAGALAYTARLWRIPPVAALALGLLGASLPDVFQIGCNPHLDALYTGIGAVLISVALRAFNPRAHAGLAICAMFCAVLLLTFRYHAVFLVIPLAIVLVCYRHTRMVGICMLITTCAALGYIYWALYVCTGSLQTASATQIATGATYRAHGDAAALDIFNDYAAWMRSHPPVTAQTIIDGIKANWLVFATRKAVLLGAIIWLLAVIIKRRAAPGSLWLPVFIAGYALAVSPTYFTPRASAITEICGLMLCSAGLGVMLFQNQRSARGRRGAGSSVGWFNPVAVGAVLTVLLMGGVGYNGWRLYPIVLQWRDHYSAIEHANKSALAFIDDDRCLLYGSLDRCGWSFSQSNLPGAVYSRWWMDDPAVSPAMDQVIPKYDPADVVAGRTPVRAVLVWDEIQYHMERQLDQQLRNNPIWAQHESGVPGANLFVRR